MKKLVLALALAGSVTAAFAQGSVKSDADIQKAIEKAAASANDAKKGLKPAPWMKLGDAYMNAYANPTAAVAYGMDKTTFSLAAGEKPRSSEIVTVDGQSYEPTTERLHPAVQWSAGLGLGLQYNLTPHIGFFAEPGLHYHFKSSDYNVRTWNTEHPLDFNVPFGLRISF